MKSTDSTADWLVNDDFAGNVADVALAIVGRSLRVVDPSGEAKSGLIVETEAYGGPDDLASHAAFKPGGRAAIMWNSPGLIYVYAAYGMYPCLNIVCGRRGDPSAVLIRGVWVTGDPRPVLGPGRVTRRLGITMDDHGDSIFGRRFGVSRNRRVVAVEATTRIGITRDVERNWRFVASDSSEAVSR